MGLLPMLNHAPKRVGLLCMGLLAALALGATARADVQGSVRSGTGFGASTGALEREFLVETTLRSELLFGDRGDEHVRLGPALELRSIDFETIEAGAGGAVLFPIARGYPIVLSALVGYAWRRAPIGDGPFAVATLAWGYRSFNFHSRYGLGLQIYVSARMHLNQPRAIEVTAGIEIDLAATVVIPVRFIVTAIRRGDPDEPEEPEN